MNIEAWTMVRIKSFQELIDIYWQNYQWMPYVKWIWFNSSMIHMCWNVYSIKSIWKNTRPDIWQYTYYWMTDESWTTRHFDRRSFDVEEIEWPLKFLSKLLIKKNE